MTGNRHTRRFGKCWQFPLKSGGDNDLWPCTVRCLHLRQHQLEAREPIPASARPSCGSIGRMQTTNVRCATAARETN